MIFFPLIFWILSIRKYNEPQIVSSLASGNLFNMAPESFWYGLTQLKQNHAHYYTWELFTLISLGYKDKMSRK